MVLNGFLNNVNPFSSRHDPRDDDDDDDFKLPKMASLAIMITMNLLLQVRMLCMVAFNKPSLMFLIGVIFYHRFIVEQVCRVLGRKRHFLWYRHWYPDGIRWIISDSFDKV